MAALKENLQRRGTAQFSGGDFYTQLPDGVAARDPEAAQARLAAWPALLREIGTF